MKPTTSIGLVLLLLALMALPSCKSNDTAKPPPTTQAASAPSDGTGPPTTSKAEHSLSLPIDFTEAARRQDEMAEALGIPKELALDLGNGVSMKLVLIPAGKFMMGSPATERDAVKKEGLVGMDPSDEGPQHEVTITKPFYMGIYEVTQEQHEAVMGTNPSHFKGATNPVENVSWDEATEFCKKLSQKTGKRVMLPTEAQWEYACRGGTTTPFNTGETITAAQANYNDGKTGNQPDKTTPVGTFTPNGWGVCDMPGNVWEWCSDWHDKDYYAKSPQTDPQGPATGARHVLRGGCWFNFASDCRSARRIGDEARISNFGMGFRVAILGPDQYRRGADAPGE